MYTSKTDEGGQRQRGSFDSKNAACVSEQLGTVSMTAVYWGMIFNGIMTQSVVDHDDGVVLLLWLYSFVMHQYNTVM